MAKFYVLKTHGNVDNHWGVNAIATFKTKKLATEFCDEQMAKAEHNIKLIVVKGVMQYKVTRINFISEAV